MVLSSGGWIILTGALVAAGCGLLGCFLVLRRLAMLGDAISHAVLPGIVVAFMVTHSRASLPMFIGAVVLGVLTTFFVQSLSQRGVQGDAAIGVTFTSLFAIGVVLVSRYTSNVDLDLECVLYGDITYTPLDVLLVGGKSWGPRAVWVNGSLLLLNLCVILALYKELKICAFDPGMAAAVGINVTAIHYLLMSLVSVTAVGAFESVGAILVVAMLIVPGATAYLLTERLSRMLMIAVGVGVLSSITGYYMSSWLNCSPAGAMATTGGGLFTLAFLFSPSHGIVSRYLAQRRLRHQVAEEDALLWAGRRAETGELSAFTARSLATAQEWLPAEASAAIGRLARSGMLRNSADGFDLTGPGRERANALIRRHRVYETYLGDLGYPTDHLHQAADRVEHYLSPQLASAVDEAARFPERDPQGKPIPPAGQS
ncbi:MAG: ABC-type Mn2+/Zn2+ transport system, permease [Armatimonadetes bacterium]|jgi:manganese/zinc/iron transport system permease protein|nr:ABC-type Mn2+/Zn2+ transport system, permease [Armatimonadota bacterium]